MKFGQLHLFENPMQRTEKEIVDEQFDIMVRAEEFGFDSIWPAEHHFSEYGYCASPAVTLAALAMRTRKVRMDIFQPPHHGQTLVSPSTMEHRKPAEEAGKRR